MKILKRVWCFLFHQTNHKALRFYWDRSHILECNKCGRIFSDGDSAKEAMRRGAWVR